jgi:hypothetical protein
MKKEKFNIEEINIESNYDDLLKGIRISWDQLIDIFPIKIFWHVLFFIYIGMFYFCYDTMFQKLIEVSWLWLWVLLMYVSRIRDKEERIKNNIDALYHIMTLKLIKEKVLHVSE